MSIGPRQLRTHAELVVFPRTPEDISRLEKAVREQVSQDAVWGESDHVHVVVRKGRLWPNLTDSGELFFKDEAVVFEDKSFHPFKLARLEEIVPVLPVDALGGVILQWEQFAQPFDRHPVDKGDQLWVVKEGKLFAIRSREFYELLEVPKEKE